jgi:hypothetical protein
VSNEVGFYGFNLPCKLVTWTQDPFYYNFFCPYYTIGHNFQKQLLQN